MTSMGLDAGASMHLLLGVILLSALGTILSDRFLGSVADERAQQWAFVSTCSALLASLWIAIANQDLPWVALPPLIVVAVSQRLRFSPQRFSRRDALLLPTALCVFIALQDTLPTLALGSRVIFSLTAVFSLRLLLAFIRPDTGLAAGYCFTFSPLALTLQTHYAGYKVRHTGWLPLTIAVLTPLALRALLNDSGKLRRRLLCTSAWIIYPVVILAYGSATSTLAAEGKAHGDLFEDAHNLTVASEMLRGERPYRDILPTHGLIQDGLLDFLILRGGKMTAGRVIKQHGAFGAIVSVAAYSVTVAATGSPDVAILTHFLSVAMGTGGAGLRAAPALLGLAFAIAAVRRRQPRLLAYATAAIVLATLTSLDYAAYTAIATIAAIFLLERALRASAVRAATAGAVTAGSLALIGLSASGFCIDFFRSTLLEIARLGPAYALPPFSAPPALAMRRFPPEVLATIFDHDTLPIIFWAATLIVVCAALVLHRNDGRISDGLRNALLVLGIWVIATGLSYGERQHSYFMTLFAPMVGSWITFLFHARGQIARFAAVLTVIVAVTAAQPTVHLSSVDMLRRQQGPLDASDEEVADVPRARGALYRPGDAAIVRSVHRYVTSALKPDETFFDFTNRGALYFLLDRDCPIRQVEVGFYERPQQQREVIARVERNKAVKLALIPKTDDQSALVDGVPNSVRAPLVWEYLRSAFRPEFEEGNVVIWRRID
ncbi:MAG TPA: hypothetical protein VHL58_09155 [Thermoanaerobaculia bacterium]|nr:hypothetical protein [Thermoanaerobaculia bacterium]